MQSDNGFHEAEDHTARELKRMVIGLIIFFSALTGVVLLLILNAQTLAQRLPFSAEKQFVAPYERLIRSQFGEAEYPQVDAYLQALAEDMAEAMELPDTYDLTVHYIDGGMQNAFATLGGHIFIFRGLIEALPDENSLAMVVAHEVAHIKHRDPMASLGRGFALQMLYGFMTGDATIAADIAGLGGEVGLSFFSREQEEQADYAALDALARHYGHVTGYATFFEQVREEEGDDPLPVWLSTHPELTSRIDYLQAYIDEQNYQRKGNPTPIGTDLPQQDVFGVD